MTTPDPNLVTNADAPVAPVVPTTPTSHAAPVADTSSDHWLPSKVYDVLKFIAQIFLPAVGTLYFALAPTWSLPRPADVVGTITAVDAFLGVFLAYTKQQFLATDAPYDGSIDVTTSDSGTKTFSLTLNGDPDGLDSQKTVVFKVNPS